MFRKRSFSAIADGLAKLLEGDPGEEDIQKYLDKNRSVFEPHHPPQADWSLVTGVLPKFPLSPDRIPDFTLPYLAVAGRQSGSRINFVELKKASAKLFVDHGRMSKDLNDAWMECQDSLRLAYLSRADLFRRILTQVKAQAEATTRFSFRSNDHNGVLDPALLQRAEYKCFIILGRRDSLQPEDLDRARQLSDGTDSRVKVATYDFLLDQLRLAESRGTAYAFY